MTESLQCSPETITTSLIGYASIQNVIGVNKQTNKKIQKQWLEPDVEQRTALKLGKEYVKDVYYQPAYLTYIQSTLCEIPGWMKSQVEINIAGRNCNKLK